MSTYSLLPSAAIVKFIYQTDSPSRPTKRVLATPHPTDAITSPTIRSLNAALFLTSYRMDVSFMTCPDKFFKNNPLLASSLQPVTRIKYAVALETLKASVVANELRYFSLDQRLAVNIQERFLSDFRERQRQEMANLICLIVLMYPSMRQKLGLSIPWVAGWRALTSSQSSTPFTKEIVQALTRHMPRRGQRAADTAVLISFVACLRISKALNLTWDRVALPGDIRLAKYLEKTARSNILYAKTARYSSKFQFVKVSDMYGIKYLQTLDRHSHRPQDRKADIFYHEYSLQALESAFELIGLDHQKFTSHSARIGKATEYFIRGEPVSQIAIHGRWKYLGSLRYYVCNRRAWILNTNILHQVQSSIQEAAAKMRSALYA